MRHALAHSALASTGRLLRASKLGITRVALLKQLKQRERLSVSKVALVVVAGAQEGGRRTTTGAILVVNHRTPGEDLRVAERRRRTQARRYSPRRRQVAGLGDAVGPSALASQSGEAPSPRRAVAGLRRRLMGLPCGRLSGARRVGRPRLPEASPEAPTASLEGHSHPCTCPLARRPRVHVHGAQLYSAPALR